jgi:hypothetical protein
VREVVRSISLKQEAEGNRETEKIAGIRCFFLASGYSVPPCRTVFEIKLREPLAILAVIFASTA